MQKREEAYFKEYIFNQKDHFPFSGMLELTYRCGLNCVHCYCKGSEDKKNELTARQWKKILDTIYAEGCLWITFTGGDPLFRNDFEDIYMYAKQKGFIVKIFTNGLSVKKSILKCFLKSPPYALEITLNGITDKTYESVTQVEGAFPVVIRNILTLKEKKIPVLIKTNALSYNKHEVVKIKQWTEKNIGKPSPDTHFFKYDVMIYPRLNGDKTPCRYRLSFEEMETVRKSDPDLRKEYEQDLRGSLRKAKGDSSSLYTCNSWLKSFFINPYGKLKFCEFSEKLNIDITKGSFKKCFYDRFPCIFNERFQTDSPCRDCSLREICYYCPARAYLETGKEEGPVAYYCEMAKKTAQRMQDMKNRKNNEKTNV